jgi:hypothetical protein
MRRRLLRRIALSLLLALAAAAEPAVPQDLLAVLTLRGKPCGGIASVERQGRVRLLGRLHRRPPLSRVDRPGNRVVIEDK